MVAIPTRLEDALRFNGYTIVQTDVAAQDIVLTPEGTLHIPALRLSSLAWQRGDEASGGEGPLESDSFYLLSLPMFSDAYRPVILSHILDRFSTRRIGYNTPDQFGLAVRRWMNLHLGPTSVLNRLYRSVAVNLPLTTQDALVTTADKVRDASSAFPQAQLAGNVDYADAATDRVGTGTQNYQGRMGRSVADLLTEQRAAYLNADELTLNAMESLFLGLYDRAEYDSVFRPAPSALGFLPTH